MSERTDHDLTEELYAFLQGVVPEGHRIDPAHVPQLSEDQAWTVIWFLGNLYWQVTDHIERCDVCKELYDTNSDGECMDWGDKPYHFCGSCCNGPEAAAKRLTKGSDDE